MRTKVNTQGGEAEGDRKGVGETDERERDRQTDRQTDRH